MKNHLDQFHEYREIFVETGVRDNFNPSCQHSLCHYLEFVQEFFSLNGLCSSITESANIHAVKKPWRRLSRFHALRQMLLTNQHLDKLQVAQLDFEKQGMLNVSLIQTIEESLCMSHSATLLKPRAQSLCSILTTILSKLKTTQGKKWTQSWMTWLSLQLFLRNVPVSELFVKHRSWLMRWW